MKTLPAKLPQNGFTLVELTMVLIIVALLSTGLMFGVSAQRSAAENADAQRQLESIREALLGFAIANGRLPCPAVPTLATGDINAGIAATPPCLNAAQYGVLPWATLGLPEADPWGSRYTYFVGSAFTAVVPVGAQTSFTLDTNGTANVKANSASTANIASDLPAIIVSHGSRPAGSYQSTGTQLGGATGDELENADNNLTFVSHIPSDTFDDQVIWILPSILKSRMVAAGRLP
ncbi:MAG: type II secretion system protein [Dechloromonas sp.]|uniref:Type II secretion system protein n=1 Tax=Candidatus Dechloromonas phosphorivorans TaxID=2899244 RepID=A0A935MPY3_9RHOO|nr:type II secretion system protein [Candidatus Dechloromonas phosphorivorans]